MTINKATLSKVEDENIHCPYCNALIYDMEVEEWTHPKDCSHFKGCITWDAQEFENNADLKVVEWWTKHQKEAEKTDDDFDMTELVECPHLDHVIEHTSSGIACGPTRLTVSFCFAKGSK